MINYPIFPLTNDQKKIINDFNNNKNIKFEYIKCEICNSENFKELFQNDCWGFKQKFVYCKNCGFCFLNPRMNKKSSDYFYSSDSYRICYDNNSNITNSEDLYQSYFKRVKEHIPAKPKLPNYKIYYDSLYFDFINHNINDYQNVLDIGCGDGTKLIDFKNIGKEVKGVEVSDICRKLHAEFGINSIQGTVDDIDDKKKYDLVILSHVFEHLSNLKEKIEKISTLTNKYLYIEVPVHVKRLQIIQNAHNYYFSKNTLNFFILNSNFDLIDLKYSNVGEPGEYLLALYKKRETQSKFEFNFVSEVKTIKYLYFKFYLKQLLKKLLRPFLKFKSRNK